MKKKKKNTRRKRQEQSKRKYEVNQRSTYPIIESRCTGMANCGCETVDNKIYYISDIHLAHQLEHSGAKNDTDNIRIIKKIVNNILQEFCKLHRDQNYKIMLIGGDISSEYALYKQFIKFLRKRIKGLQLDIVVVVILGNHELWNQQDKDLDEIVDMYRTVLKENGMYLVYNEILYIENKNNIFYIPEHEILSCSKEYIREKLRNACITILGGIGFAGRNENFNANQGIYRATINRDEEIELSQKFDSIYNRIKDVLFDEKIIVFTHMNIKEWGKDKSLYENYVYVCGHSHINNFYDDGVHRLYADNQVGYYNDKTQLKYFLFNKNEGDDYFNNYEDGIYKIDKEDYKEFYRRKNLKMTFTRDAGVFMLKKKGYYSFILKNKSGKLSMLNGGAIKSLKSSELEYYYQNMEAEIEYIKAPLLKYQNIQNQISRGIQKLGGSGRIHGAIIDIDGNPEENDWWDIACSHLYVNPLDLKITPYYAYDKGDKYVYPSVPALLKDRCLEMFKEYQKLIESGEKNEILIREFDKNELEIKPIHDTNTDIYRISGELSKMQKLNFNILCIWYDNIPSSSEFCGELMSVPLALQEKCKDK